MRVYALQNNITNLITFEFNGDILQIDEVGRLHHWPDGFCCTNEKFLDYLVNYSY